MPILVSGWNYWDKYKTPESNTLFLLDFSTGIVDQIMVYTFVHTLGISYLLTCFCQKIPQLKALNKYLF